MNSKLLSVVFKPTATAKPNSQYLFRFVYNSAGARQGGHPNGSGDYVAMETGGGRGLLRGPQTIRVPCLGFQ